MSAILRRICVALGIFFPLLAPAQNQPAPPAATASDNGSFTFHVNSKLVLLDVVVTDRKGNVVTNLKQDDFQVFEDGRPEQILNFEAPGLNAPPPVAKITSTAELDRVAPQAPVNIVVLDEINTKFEDMAFARYSLKKYLEAQPDKLNQPTMLAAVTLKRFVVLQDYTQDKNVILDALSHHFAQYPWHYGSDSWNAEKFTRTFAALLQVAEATAGHPGHKNMIWIGRGFPSIRVDEMMPDEADNLTATIQMCINKLRDARITLYTVDPVGLSTTETTDVEGFDLDDPFGSNIQFDAVAVATGGKPFYGRNDVNAEIGTSIHNGTSFYTLSYRPDNQSDLASPFRSIRVVMKDHNLRATTREGYYTSTAAEAISTEPDAGKKQMLFDMFAAADTTLVYDGIPVEITQRAGDPWNLGIRVDEQSLTWSNHDPSGERAAQIQFLIASFNRNNKMIRRTAQTITIHDPNLHRDSSRTPKNIYLRFRLPHEIVPARVRVVVRDPDSGKVGAANLDFVAK